MHSLAAIGAVAAVSLGVALAVTGYLVNARAGLRWLDHPNARSLHTRAVPRTGGLGILIGAGVGWIIAASLVPFPVWWNWALGGVLLIALVSLLDDWRGLGVVVRLVAHLGGAALLLGSGLGLQNFPLPGFEWTLPPWLGLALTVPFVVWMVNLYNFMDGMDGFAGGMALIGFACMSLLGFAGGDVAFGLFTLAVALAAAGFLRFNYPPARIFMGDAGASTLGFLAALAMLWADREGLVPLWAGLLIFSPFVVDATATLLLRVRAGEKFWDAHRRHSYQILVRHGWGHRRTVLAGYLLMILVAVSAGALVVSGEPAAQWAVLLVWTVVYGIIWQRVRRLERCL